MLKNYQIPVRMPSPQGIIGIQDPILTMGSCFAEGLGCLLERSKFEIKVNPFGILFNPVSIEKVLQLALNGASIGDYPKLLVPSDGLWHSMYHHGRFSRVDRTALIEDVDAVNRAFRQTIQDVNHVVITLGTAHAYRLKSSGEIVANCHKVHADLFEKHLLQIDEIISSLEATILQLRRVNPKLTFFFSVSPVRYIRDGLVESMRSKAHLISAAHHVIGQHENCQYFPAYELVVDELRDYRFYEEDLVHPNRTAVRYVMDQFLKTYFTEEARKQMLQMEGLMKSLEHRPIHRESKAHEDFLAKLEETIRTYEKEYRNLDFRNELELVRQMRSAE